MCYLTVCQYVKMYILNTIVHSLFYMQVAAMAIKVYSAARDFAATRGIIIADTKFEFGLDKDGTLGKRPACAR